MATASGPDLPYMEWIKHLDRVSHSAFEFEAECEAYDTAPDQSGATLFSVSAAWHAVDAELGLLLQEIEKVKERYSKMARSVKEKENEQR